MVLKHRKKQRRYLIYVTIPLWALDTPSIPAMSAECEKVFSSAKKPMTAEGNALADDAIKACECLKVWWDQGLIRRQRRGTSLAYRRPWISAILDYVSCIFTLRTEVRLTTAIAGLETP